MKDLRLKTNKMINKIFVLILLLNIGLFSQQPVIFKNPPSDMTMPLVMPEENGIPKSSGLVPIETKWIQLTDANIEGLLQLFSSSSEIGINKLIKDIFINANIPESKLNQLKIRFTSTGIEERSIDKDAVVFSDDFAAKYPTENLLLVTKLYRTKNAVIELTDGGGAEFDQSVKDALSQGLRFGNKTETVLDNKMVIEIQHLVFAYESVPIAVTRIVDQNIVVPVYLATDVGINSIGSMTVTEFGENDYFVKVVSPATLQPVEFRISSGNPNAKFRVGGRESYTIKYLEISGNKVTFSISGFEISFK
ncbi:MAG: hypothetical protein K8I03_07635 [Ignavibacteria bacterium]|nr:hypothetical protein [Ignavibacteria bacterium]